MVEMVDVVEENYEFNCLFNRRRAQFQSLIPPKDLNLEDHTNDRICKYFAQLYPSSHLP